jgi:hypothetical protein
VGRPSRPAVPSPRPRDWSLTREFPPTQLGDRPHRVVAAGLEGRPTAVRGRLEPSGRKQNAAGIRLLRRDPAARSRIPKGNSAGVFEKALQTSPRTLEGNHPGRPSALTCSLPTVMCD